ncbi:MAG: hypothetical protein ACRD1X_19885, partial [Vicinamibacteria bacterium]
MTRRRNRKKQAPASAAPTVAARSIAFPGRWILVGVLAVALGAALLWWSQALPDLGTPASRPMNV